jgi:hypothetical protein
VPEFPDRAAITPVLASLGDRRLVIRGSDASLAAIVTRLLRAEALEKTIVGFLPDRDSEVAALWRMSTDPDEALRVALTGEVDPVPIVRDDAGGVLVGRGELHGVRGVAYCDDARILRGQASKLIVTPDRAGLAVTVVQRGLLGKKVRTTVGRAMQLGCLESVVLKDGVPHSRPVTKWTWYEHTAKLRLVQR